jgi:hypothetical protein
MGVVVGLVLINFIAPAWAWNNGGDTRPGNSPQLATHDWIALYALLWMPEAESWWIAENPIDLSNFLLGTELPDNSGHPLGIGDTSLHHVYYFASGTLQDGSAANRAQDEFDQALSFLDSGNYSAAALHARVMSHYIIDVGVFGHVMGSGTDWGAEAHHGDYEDYVETRTNEFPMDDFSVYLSYDGSLATIDAHDAALNIAYDTTFGGAGGLGCAWMDTHYDWNNPTFKNRAGASINLCANALADVFHTLHEEMNPEAKICSFSATFRHNLARMIQPDMVPGKALGCINAWVSDWLASGFVFDKLASSAEGLDTNPSFVNQTSGNAIGDAGVGIISFGGPVVNPCVKYAESGSTPLGGRAPIRFHDEGGIYYFQRWDGSSIPGASLPVSVINDDEDMFVIETYRDSAGRFIMLCYGFGWKGTYAAGKYFDKIVYPNTSSFRVNWLIVRWQDSNGDGFVNAPGEGDSYTLVDSA